MLFRVKHCLQTCRRISFVITMTEAATDANVWCCGRDSASSALSDGGKENTGARTLRDGGYGLSGSITSKLFCGTLTVTISGLALSRFAFAS